MHFLLAHPGFLSAAVPDESLVASDSMALTSFCASDTAPLQSSYMPALR